MTRPIWINSMFRSGSTLLMRLLSTDPEIHTVYCEPLHNNLRRQVIRLDHYKNQGQRPQVLAQWRRSFAQKDLHLQAGQEQPVLKSYLSHFQEENTLTKFVRLPLRSTWITHTFEQPFILAQIRDPRAFCNSMLKERNSDIFSSRCTWNAYQAKDWFQRLSRQPEYHSACRELRKDPPYVKILFLWKLCAEELLAGQNTAKGNLLIRYEDLVSDPLHTLSRVYSGMGRTVPEAVQHAALPAGTDTEGKETRKWEKGMSTSYKDEWKTLDTKRFDLAIQKINMQVVMSRLEYEI